MTRDGDYHVESFLKWPKHYHGDVVRVLFVAIAMLIFLTEFVGARLPFTSSGIITMVLVLVISAGITNPAQKWIHILNMGISIFGTMIFGNVALSKLNVPSADISQVGTVTLISVLFLCALYFATRTVRGRFVTHVD
ncbi:MAG: hypothetical protein KBC16_02955 [Candidatus Pacebacteria bacterium]|nr:hypothetical protein [Candidatus Paceibacterota bacterium]